MTLRFRPLERLEVTSPFGERELNGAEGQHLGVDYRAAIDTPIVATAAGVVDKVNETAAGGLQLFVTHDDGTRIAYSHLHAVYWVPGERVKAGELLALTGNSGHTTGPHLHLQFQERVGATPVDPHPFLRALPFPSSSTARSTSSPVPLLLGLGAAFALSTR